MKTEQVKTIVIGVLVIGLITAGYFAFLGSPANLSGQVAAEKAINYVNSQVLTGQDKASIDGKVVSESGVYKFSVKVASDSFPSYVTKDGKLLFPQVIKIEETTTTIGEFTVSNEQVCLEDGKPIVYFFGLDSCSHCKWEHPIVQKVAKLFEGVISFHDNMNDNGKDADIFAKYSPEGGVPTLVIGCKYYRIGAVEEETEQGAIEAENNFISLICETTNSQPAGLCVQP